MKKLAIYFALIACMSSCKKDDPTSSAPSKTTAVKKYPVAFSAVNSIGPQKTNKKAQSVSDIPLNEYGGSLTYIVYGGDRTYYHMISQDSTGKSVKNFDSIWYPDLPRGFKHTSQQSYGTVKDTLPPGNYTIVMIASKDQLDITVDFLLRLSTLSIGRMSSAVPKDVFFKKFVINVGEGPLEQDVVLSRIVAKAEFHIADAKAGNSYKFLFITENIYYRFGDEMPIGDSQDLRYENRLPSIAGKPNLFYSVFLLNTETPMDIIIKGYEDGNLSTSKQIEDVRFFRNKRTILKGNVHTGGITTSGFTVTVNDEFDSDSTVVEL